MTLQPSDPIETLGLTARPYNSLRRGDVDTIADLTGHSDLDLLDIRNFGPHALAEVQTALTRHGLALKPEPASNR